MNTSNPLEAALPDAALYAAYAEGRADEAEARRDSIARAVVLEVDPVHSALHELLAEEQRNKHRPPVVRLTGERQATVNVYGFDMLCTFEYFEGEAPVLWGPNPCPGSPSYCEFWACHVGGVNGVGSVDIFDLLDDRQIERIEERLLEEMEF